MQFAFDVRMHEDFGTIGLRMCGKPHFDPVSGMGAAHDILEHFPRDGGEMEDEMQAMGASLYVRGDSYFSLIGNRYDAVRNLAADFVFTFNDLMHDGMLRDPGRWRAHAAIAEQLEQMGPAIRREFTDNDVEVPLWVMPGEPERRLLGWVNMGYRRAIQRYKASTTWLPGYFRQVEKEADRMLRVAEGGDKVVLHVNVAGGSVRGEICYDE